MKFHNIFIAISALVLFFAIFHPPAMAKKWKLGQPVKIAKKDQKQPTEDKAAMRIGAPPIMPRRAKTSGYCCMLMDIDEKGMPQNIRTSYCSDKVFAKASIEASKKWRFAPAIKDGKPRAIKNQTYVNKFYLRLSNGRLVPDPDRMVVRRGKRVRIPKEKMCAGNLIS